MPKDEVDKAKEELTEDRFAQEYLADFRKTEGVVYKEFKRERHIIKGEVDEWIEEKGQSVVRRYGGVDFGFNHPAAVLSIDETSDGLFVVRDEWYHSGKTDEQIAEYTAAKKYHNVYPDPANAGGVEELRRQGVNVRDVIKGKDSIKNGINAVRELFKSDRLFIHESCENTIFELETYSYPDSKDGGKTDENPMKENDDAMDAMRYVLMMVAHGKGHNKMRVRRPTYTGFNKVRYNV
jgi:phage terminase large subunit